MHTHRSAAPYDPSNFATLRVPELWEKYDGILTFGRGRTLALLDDGCDITHPVWQANLPWGPKNIATWNAIDHNDDCRPGPIGYHGTSIGWPSSQNHGGVIGIAYNDYAAQVRSASIVHLVEDESRSIADALGWVIANHQKYNITAVNLAVLDDKPHARAVPTAIDAPLARLKQLGVWVSAPCGNNEYTTGISWPACAEDCFAIGAILSGSLRVHRDRWRNTDLVVPAEYTSSSNAYAAAAAMILREAIEKTAYPWHDDGATLPDAMLSIMKRSGHGAHDPATGITFRRLDLLSAVDWVFGDGR